MQTFSDDTGQVYVETTTPAQSMITSFMNNCTGRQQDPRHYQHPSGAAKLVHMATRTSVWNIYDPGMPETLPYFSKEFEVMKRIYLHLKETDTLTFKAWKLFHVAFPDDFKENFRVSILRQYGGVDKIDTIHRHISSLSSTTLTFLCITNLTLNSVNLNTDLLRFSNLGALILQSAARRPFGESEDRMIKNWGLSVTLTKAFQKLRVLTLTHFDISVHETLDGLANFPALKLCRLEFIHVPPSLLDAWTKGSAWLHPKGNWRQWLTNEYVPSNMQVLQRLADIAQSDREGDRNPETVFGRVDLTTHTKMEMLHDISALYVEAPKTDLPIVSVHYGNTAPNLTSLSHSAWFVRISPTEKDMPPKHATEQESGNKNHAKKRKLRDGKGMGIESMLGNFV